MNYNKLYIALTFLTLAFTSCQEDLYTGPCNVRFKAYVQDEVSVTRADDNTYQSVTGTGTATLYVSYSSNVENSSTSKSYDLTWNDGKVSSSIPLEIGNYNFYGYAPKLKSNDVSTNFENTTLTLSNIPALYDKDLMVIKPCSTTVSSDDISKGSKSVPLQMDHLLAKITPCFYLNRTYAELRDIRIKKVVFSFDSAPTYIATVNYTTSSHTIGYELSQNSQACNVIAYDVAEPTNNLPPTKENDADTQVYQECGYCYIVPTQSAANLKMTVTYDVYDKSGVCTREGATATNQIKNLSQQTLAAGTNYKLNIQVIPTYLYVLSDNDQGSVLLIQ